MTLTPKKTRNVLITGFGPFGPYKLNPSWEAVKPLHGRTIDTGQGEVKLHVLQLPVKYAAVLDTLARVHASRVNDNEFPVPHPALKGIAQAYFDPHWVEKGWAGDGRSYPLGFNSPPPDGGWDAVLHCGVGAPGNVRIETLARHEHYGRPDCTGQLAPRLDAGKVDSLSQEEIALLPWRQEEKEGFLPSEPAGLAWGWILACGRALLSVWSCLLHLLILSSPTRGFPIAAFSDFAPILTPKQAGLSPLKLLHHLRTALGNVPVELSHNAGLFVCEWTLYDSLAESSRVANLLRQTPRPVLFVHCPPHSSPSWLGRARSWPSTGDVPTETVTTILQEVAVYMGMHSL